MKIEPGGRPEPVSSARPTEGQVGLPGEAKRSEVGAADLSPNLVFLQKIVEAAKKAPDVRPEKVQKALTEPSVGTDVLARAMLRGKPGGSV